MKNLLEKVRSFLSSLASKLKRKPKPESAPQAESAPSAGQKPDRFTLISWAVTIVIVVALLASTIIYKNSVAASGIGDPQATSEPGITPPLNGGPVAAMEGNGPYILRDLQLKTNIPERPRYESLIYRVSRGDAMLSIAGEFDLESESILYVNTDLEDNPHNLKPGMELLIPPVDGIYHEWEEGDTFESVAEEFFAEPEDIINFPGNQIDLTDPQVQVGTTIMIPGGSRELRNWAADLPTQGRGADTGTGEIQGNVCGGGPVASGFGWPAGSHAISGNGYGPGHLGIDIQANEGEPVYAAGSGIVTMAQGGWNYGYGNVVQIDHGNGYVTIYAHLSQINVGLCTPVGQGTVLGAAGNTGNSFGAHLHFEVRQGGSNVNPYQIVQ
jgi:murein DD-endopeptidase MepM/ murein hydrolase activator NlpD